jgi:DNA-binding SARP family transcriptional activator
MTAARPHLQLLGGFRLRQDGHAVAIPETVAKLLALLALQERPLTRSRVAGSLWPEQAEARAFANLRALVWRLPPESRSVVRAAGTTLAIEDNVDVDVQQARDVVRDLLDATVAPAPSQTNVDLLSRPLLPEWDADWLTFERERTRQLHIHALETWGHALLASGDALSAVDVSLSVVGEEPLRESAHLLLVDAYLACGNRADAHRTFERYRDVLHRELHLEPVVRWTDLLDAAHLGQHGATHP